MVTAATNDYGDLYTIIGMPLSVGEQAVNNFIVEREVTGVTHVLGTDSLWGQYGALGTPSWMTITASGETKVGVGALTRNVIIGEWVD